MWFKLFKINLLFAAFFTTSFYAQNIPLKFEIDSVNVNKTNIKSHRYTIFYKAINLTNKPLTFFLLPNSMIANAASSMTLFPIYRIYQNDVLTELDGPFYENYPGELTEEDLSETKQLSAKQINDLIEKQTRRINLILEMYKKNGGTSTDLEWIIQNDRLRSSKMVLMPNEIRSLNIKTSWNKKRYFNQDNLEYYLNKNDKYEIELTFDLKRDLWKNTISDKEFKEIQSNKSIIQGVFKTNKIAIEFND